MSDAEELQKILDVAGDRRIILSIGGQRVAKGTTLVADAWISQVIDHKQYLLVMYGIPEDFSDQYIQQVLGAGAVYVDRAPSDWLWKQLLTSASLVWARYDVAYDRSSGIVCRGVQLGKLVIVRKSSMIASNLGGDLLVEMADEFPNDLLDAIADVPCDKIYFGRKIAEAGYEHTVGVLRGIFGSG
jgi:hypothetical protein